jgi:tRNA threonylcarbamoyladenosine biosynthesis protein TsaE
MIQFGEKLAKSHKIILLEGELWAGKTTFTKGFAQWLGIENAKVQSPTYAYLNSYDNKLLHIDMYRIETYDQIIEKWIKEQIEEHEYIIIERPKFIEKINLGKTAKVVIKKIDTKTRKIKLEI